MPSASPPSKEANADKAFGVLFKKWSGAGTGKGKRESSGSVDLKEFSDMLKSHQLKVIESCSCTSKPNVDRRHI